MLKLISYVKIYSYFGEIILLWIIREEFVVLVKLENILGGELFVKLELIKIIQIGYEELCSVVCYNEE